MELKKIAGKITEFTTKYKYAFVVLLVGILLLCLPGKNTSEVQTQPIPTTPVEKVSKQDALAELLQSIHGVGRVKVLLSTASGEETIYQTDSDITTATDNGNTRIDTVIITDSQRNENGLIRQINPPMYLGAVVVCDGADNATVRLAVTQAVARITGLGADAICVLKMK